MANWKTIEGNLATPCGFRAAAISAAIKKAEGALDLALIASDSPSTSAAGVFTTNRVAAAPVIVSRQHLESSGGRIRAVVVNAGNANACTGRAGIRTAQFTARETSKLLGIDPGQVAVASTGVIGVPLKRELILNALPRLVAKLSRESAGELAQAIMTTDTFPKTAVLSGRLGGKPVHIAGVAKGSGMIHPHMATMLSFVTTDAVIPPHVLDKMLHAAAEVSFNCVTVDGDTSTNDTLLIMASGASGVSVRPGTKQGSEFLEGLTVVCQSLARMIAKDGEGAKKLVTVEVHGARSPTDADRVARAISNSPLVKTAIAGSDPNWGRILCAAGYSGAAFDPAKVDVRVNGLYLCRRGLDSGFDEAAAKKELDRSEITLLVDLHQGKSSARIWTCDLTHEYITINASYRT